MDNGKGWGLTGSESSLYGEGGPLRCKRVQGVVSGGLVRKGINFEAPTEEGGFPVS